jgi:hypothetical protein
MRGFRIRTDGVSASAIGRWALAGLPVVLALLSLSGLDGFRGVFLSPGVAFAIGVAAFASARIARNLYGPRLGAEIGQALALVACAAALFTALEIGAL